ncbi:FAD-binding domain-containing protein [Mycena sanguinolenta]|uniref:FAD-binding domain-containing protein n=1 Tax=Mycena sanguinolenta TaxID=230812 RepID=A0A8H7CLD5_9AGAR|nr:FAD-binding domain-containing protein [Mycena sanguinolenta]
MKFLVILIVWAALGHSAEAPVSNATCRSVPGSPGYPRQAEWDALNATVSGRLVAVVPSAKFCASLPGGACTDDQWESAVFRSNIPGAMDQVNWEQGYDLNPPSLCLRNTTSTCGQGDVPLYSVEAETVADIQAAVKFSSTHNLRLVIKSSGHDYLGRSTAPSSLLIRTHNLQNISFSDSFFTGSTDMGAAVTLGSGAYTNALYAQGKAEGKIVVGASAATVCAAGGWVQGAGHSALAPTLGLGADNALGECPNFRIVVANGDLLKVNQEWHPDLFYALRGGGAGSWGVLVSATFKTYPTFNVTSSVLLFGASNTTVAASLALIHAQHIFDWDSVHAGQYFYLEENLNASTSDTTAFVFSVNTIMPKTTVNQSQALLAPFLEAALALPGVSLLSQEFDYGDANDALFQADDSVGDNAVLGSRLIPAATYRDSPATVGKVYEKLLETGAPAILGLLVAGGKVAENANISSAVHPAWRTAKAHVIVIAEWDDSASLAEINQKRHLFQNIQAPILDELIPGSGDSIGSYSNEADVLERNFQTTFFGPNYARLSEIKRTYDPQDLFIVGAGVGSERWDEWGLCRL